MTKLSEVFCGAVFGRLTVVRAVKVQSPTRLYTAVEATCSCGKTVTVHIANIGTKTLSCGCLRRELAKARAKVACVTHGLSKSGTYKSWRCMIDRCFSSNHPKHSAYKNRAPAENWRKFENFYRDMGDRPDGCSIERVNNDLPYSKENCVWLPNSEQTKNKSDTVRLTNGKETYCFAEAARIMGIPPKNLRPLIFRRGRSLKEALGPEWDWVDPKVGEAAAAAAAAVKARKAKTKA